MVWAAIGSPRARIFCPCGQIGALSPNEFPRSTAHCATIAFALALHVFLHDDGVRARRQRRAGKDADRLPRADR